MVSMRIEIRDDSNAVIITFHTHAARFESDYERTKFFRELHGWKQTVPNNGKKYSYWRRGLLDDVPHIKVADSAFIVALKNAERLLDYLDEWANKVDYEMMEILMRDERLIEQLLTARVKFPETLKDTE